MWKNISRIRKENGEGLDKYIKMLLIKLSPKYKITVTTIMFFDEEKERFSNIIKLYIKNKETRKTEYIDCNGKRALVGELMKWQRD